MKHKGLLFDLDGVIVDTAKYHYIAWKEIAEELGVFFTEKDNERLKGVSRKRSFEIILEIGKQSMNEMDQAYYCSKKNEIYLSYIMNMKEDEVLPGVREFLHDAKRKDYKIALGSASKNAKIILDRLRLVDMFDAIMDGTKVINSKPDPEVFLKGAEALGLMKEECIVFEDAVAGIEAAHAGGMLVIGIGNKELLSKADLIIPGFIDVYVDWIEDELWL
jgi:beta-phosphoglucomutase